MSSNPPFPGTGGGHPGGPGRHSQQQPPTFGPGTGAGSPPLQGGAGQPYPSGPGRPYPQQPPVGTGFGSGGAPGATGPAHGGSGAPGGRPAGASGFGSPAPGAGGYSTAAPAHTSSSAPTSSYAAAGPGPQSGGAPAQQPPGAAPAAAQTRRRGPGWLPLIAFALLAALIGGALGIGTAFYLDAQDDRQSQEEVTIETPDWTTIAAEASKSVVAIQVGVNGQMSGVGSGFVYGDQGYVITNNHVVAAADTAGGEVQVVTNSGAMVTASIVGRDPETDIAVLELDQQPEGVTPLSVGESGAMQVGDPVMALGNPLGLADTVTTGIVSALNRPVTTSNIGENPSEEDVALTITNAIQTDAAINPGNSGGPLVNGQGEVIGVNSSTATLQQPGSGGQSGSIGIGFAIPISQATNIADQLISTGTAVHPHLGVSITSGEVEAGGISRGSAVVSSVEGGSAAEQAGIQQGDHIIALDDTPVNSSVSLQALVRSKAVGDTVSLTVVRGGQETNIQVTLGSN